MMTLLVAGSVSLTHFAEGRIANPSYTFNTNTVQRAPGAGLLTKERSARVS
jgi:hypothetical protein